MARTNFVPNNQTQCLVWTQRNFNILCIWFLSYNIFDVIVIIVNGGTHMYEREDVLHALVCMCVFLGEHECKKGQKV